MTNRSPHCIFAALMLAIALTVPSALAQTQSTSGSITALALNPTTNRIYVAFDGSIEVIDGAGNAVLATLPISGLIAVNPNTNRVYVAHAGAEAGSLVSAIDGGTNTAVATTRLTSGPSLSPSAIALNPTTNTVYVVHCPSQGCDNQIISVMDGANNAIIATIPVSRNAGHLAVNPRTNRIYLSDRRSDDIAVFDGATNNVITFIPFPRTFSPPVNVVVNPTTNRIYAGGAIIDGETNTVVGVIPVDVVAANPATNRLYGFPATSNDLAAVDGASNAIVATLPVSGGVAVNPTTNRIYVAPPGGTAITVIDGAGNTVIGAIALPTPPAPRDARLFAQTGFRIDNDTFWDYFNRRGGIRTFGYPVSRTFTFLGFTTQFFQREIMQLGPDGAARTLNILDPDLMPYTTINGATFPGVDAAITARAPVPGSPGYDTAVLSFVLDHAPDRFEGMNTNYFQTFASSVTLEEAFPGGGGDPNLLHGFALELWGVPTSKPARDPNNGNFVYLRFQRGVMHFDAANNVTQGLLLADYLKSILTGQSLPSDLDAQARGTRFYKQYNPAKPQWIDRPDDLPATDLTNVFQTQ